MIVLNIYKELQDHLKIRHVTVINGMRRVGKSTALKYLLNCIKHTNKIYLDCERIEIRNILNIENYETIKDELELKGLTLNKTCVIGLDEIQLIKNLPSLVKYFYDTYRVKFILTGSSSFYMKNQFGESLAGRKKIFEMFPLSFDEFVKFKGVQLSTFNNYKLKPFNKSFYNRFKDLYNEYIEFGGFPEVVLCKRKKDKADLLKDIINSYIELDVRLMSDYSASEELYKFCKLLTARVGSKIDISKISSASGISRHKISEYINLLQYTYFIYLVTPFTKNADKEISSQPKLYFADTGILNQLGLNVPSGALFENMVACQLNKLGKLNFYQKKTGQEIDFILNEKFAIEVKETPIEQDFKKLESRANDLGLKQKMLIGKQPPNTDFANFTWAANIF